ncbi:MAG: hypothetical protein KAV87_60305, partial [Desulfobacteraceae bacterium]|nr:hypothetical protein [Desulfobacteraceae bacterium]
MPKKAACALLILAILGCVIAMGTVFTYIMCLVMLITAILFGLLLLAVNLVWKLLPANFKKSWEEKKILLSAIILFSIFLFFFIEVIIDRLRLYSAPGFISFLGNAAIFIFAVFWGWSLIIKNKGKTIVAGNIVFILFIALLSFVSSASLKSSEIAEAYSIEKLKSLPYITWISAKDNIDKTGVIKHYPELAFDGINLYNSSTLPVAYLTDMNGNIVHKWARKINDRNHWQHVKMCKDGDLLVIVGDKMLIRLDWDSKVKWEKKMRTHHDVAVDEDKNIYAIAREDGLVFLHGVPVPILNDYIVVLSSDGKIKKKIYIYDLVK